MKQIAWMSRDKGTFLIQFWDHKPRKTATGHFISAKDDDDGIESGSVGEASMALVENPPKPGTCVVVESFQPIRTKETERA